MDFSKACMAAIFTQLILLVRHGKPDYAVGKQQKYAIIFTHPTFPLTKFFVNEKLK
jgi:hypothetical protein